MKTVQFFWNYFKVFKLIKMAIQNLFGKVYQESWPILACWFWFSLSLVSYTCVS